MRDLRLLGETFVLVALTWVLLGWPIDRAIAQADGTVTWIPFARSALEAGPNWTEHLYRFGVLGGSAMHGAGGTPVSLQLCALLGLGPTTTANLMTVLVQVCFGFFSIVLVEALATTWRNAPRALSAAERVATVWLSSFAPIIAWRIAFGHHNLLLGLLPFVALISLWWRARTGTTSVTALVIGAFAIAEGMSGLGQQMLVYGAVFGAPLAVVTVLHGKREPRWHRDHLLVIAVVIAAVLAVLPRLACMLQYQLGPDASRGIGQNLVHSYGGSLVRDWLTSIPWSERASANWPGTIPGYETNYPFGPWVALVAVALPRRARGLAIAMGLGTLLAIAFALEVPGITDALLAIPTLEAFRVPARAVLPVLVFGPPLALASLFTREEPAPPRAAWAAIVAGAVCIVLARTLPAIVREIAAWGTCIAIAWAARRRSSRPLVALIGIVAGLGVAAFDERVPHHVPFDRIEHGPARIREAVLAQAPDTASPLVRVQLPNAPPPFEMSTAFAAGLSSLDGAWFPPRRFLELLSILSREKLSSATGVFALTHTREFPVLQQLYNVRYSVSLVNGSIQELAPTSGPAWFPARVHTVESPQAIHFSPATVGTDGWLLSADRPPPATNAACGAARVIAVAAANGGQLATIRTSTPTDCVLVVATNYISALRASAEGRELRVFPIDISLTGILVPRGAHLIALAPAAFQPWWVRAAGWLGIIGIVAAAGVLARRQHST